MMFNGDMSMRLVRSDNDWHTLFVAHNPPLNHYEHVEQYPVI